MDGAPDHFAHNGKNNNKSKNNGKNHSRPSAYGEG